MTIAGNSNSQRNRSVIAAGIVSVDSVNGEATAWTRRAGTISVDFGHAVGAIHVTPTVGEQWYVESVDGIYIPRSRIPFNDPNQMATNPTQGQHIVGGGNGPVTLSGTIVNVGAPLNTQSVPTTDQPAASSVPAGTQIYDSTLSTPVWSNGTAWVAPAGGSGSGFKYIGPTTPDTSTWSANDFWYDTSTE